MRTQPHIRRVVLSQISHDGGQTWEALPIEREYVTPPRLRHHLWQGLCAEASAGRGQPLLWQGLSLLAYLAGMLLMLTSPAWASVLLIYVVLWLCRLL